MPQRGLLPAVKDVPWVDVVVGEGKGRWVACMVNRDPSRARDVELTFPWSIAGTSAEALAAAKADPKVAQHLAGKTIVKEVFVPGKLAGFVVK